ncbi:hypothetical protein [Cellulosilyticum lentocellum]|uniref:Uncharacterized protein n=1 Tax=Cellulosilyticum lentocellum (strain ATCC 49066 / DSM 5427 / NCIMB 11756 / RHM5) TaxID=642492 RepID=F2JPV2_CELLD|nr:hypothetical protein [Cellulosilyticum lentocellum]ADZ84887.1 hypothetical protein Clole_3193 [Cellulosilyticum lentocellum DSM 5427]
MIPENLSLDFKRLWIWGMSILMIVLIIFLGSNTQLKGIHLLENIISDGKYTFYVDATQTGSYTFDVTTFAKNASYEVYNEATNELVSKGEVGYNSIGYYPFINMTLDESNTYKVILELKDKNTFKLVNLKLYLN